MNQAQLFYDLDKRLRTDTGTGGLFNSTRPLVTGFFNNYASDTQDMPYIVYSLVSGVTDDTFAGDETDVDFQLSVYASKRPPGLALAQKILDRIYGNGIKQSNRIPTYGLHRYQMTTAWPDAVDTSDKWRYTSIVARGAYEQHEEDYYHFGRVWNVRMTKDYASTQ